MSPVTRPPTAPPTDPPAVTPHALPDELGEIAAYLAGEEWSGWVTFARSSNLFAARYRVGGGVWQVVFGGKPRTPTRKEPVRSGDTPKVCYQYEDARLTPGAFWTWVKQYGAGGSAGIWFDLHVKRNGITGVKVALPGGIG